MEIKIRRNKAGDIIYSDSNSSKVFKGSSARIELFVELEKALKAQDEVLAKVRRREENDKENAK